MELLLNPKILLKLLRPDKYSSMDYTEVNFKTVKESPITEILIAELSQIGYESFVEEDDQLLAYIPVENFNEQLLSALDIVRVNKDTLNYTHKVILDQNWNEVWESNYEPVMVAGKVFIRAPFHNPEAASHYEIIIEPKMSFGTAHHETTSLVIELMLDLPFENKRVLDMGCGTGILAIFSELLGAKEILAVDNDEWAVNNTIENIRKNKCKNINVMSGEVEVLENLSFDVILANINRNVLLQDIQHYRSGLTDKGKLILSGFYTDDLSIIENETKKHGLQLKRKVIKNNWIAAEFWSD